MIASPPWYRWLESRLEPTWPLQVAIALAIVGITAYLLYRRNPVAMAGWLTYLLMP